MKKQMSVAMLSALVAGCATQQADRPAGNAPPLELRLIETGELVIPAGCEPVDGRTYRTRFVVLADGRVTRAAPDSAAGCVQDALARWVETYRYAPLPQDVPTVIDWMIVTARRGG